ncbi:MAG TPA: glycosyltransferase family 1 protein, partial [Planctomycetota bacterium]|nr:glycosyltransferase family 1 protein [Planctomycetota bacterium]
PASPLGKVLQKWIGRGLSRAHALVCVSHATSADVERIIVRNGRPKTQVVHTGLSYPYRRLSVEETDARIAASQVRLPGVFLLHVGSSLRRKNREAVLRTLARLHPDKVAGVVFAGAPLNESQRALAVQLGVRERTVEVIGPSNELLEALYNRAHCLLFPSRFEGFGWPIIEAQACGCPVTCGNGTSLPEIAGDGAIIVDPDDDQKLAEAVTELLAPARRAELIAQGTANVARFSVSQMVQEYIAVYREALKQ